MDAKVSLMAPMFPTDFGALERMAVVMGRSNLWPGVKTPEQAIAIVALGASLGFTAPQAMQLFHIVEGRPSLSAAGKAAVMQAAPEIEYVYPIECTNEIATVEGKRRGAPGPVRASYTIEEAIVANRCSRAKDGRIVAPGRSGKPGAWETATSDMLYARALSRLSTRIAPDLLMGISTTDEMEQIIDSETPEPRGSVRVEQRTERPRATAAETVARRAEMLRRGSAPPAAGVVEDAEVVRTGRDALTDALTDCGITPADFDAWCAHNGRPVFATMDRDTAAQAADWLLGSGAEVVRRWHLERAKPAQAAAAPSEPDCPSPDDLQAALEAENIPAELSDAWARHKGIKPATVAGARALWLSIMRPESDEFSAFMAEWDKANPEAETVPTEQPSW